MWQLSVQWATLVAKAEGQLVRLKFQDLLVVDDVDGGYLVETSMVWLPQPCFLPGKAQEWMVVRQLVFDSSMDEALASILKTGHLRQL